MILARREFSAAVKRAAWYRASGICECWRIPGWTGCGRPIGPGNVFYEHIICDGIGGEPTLDNCAAITKTCWKRKTAEYDIPTVAKAKRVTDRDIGIRRSEQKWRRVIPGSRASPVIHRMNGRTEWRHPRS
jgi:hypothetical protein